MHNTRRSFLVDALCAGAASAVWCLGRLARSEEASYTTAERVLQTVPLPDPIRIKSIELLRRGDDFLVQVNSEEGHTGLATTNSSRMAYAYPILLKRVAPFFQGQDARELDRLIDGVFVHESNYKLQGLAFWLSVASVEFAILDMLGKACGRPIGHLLGGLLRTHAGVYLAQNHRGTSAEESAERIASNASKAAFKAVKFKIGGRLGHTDAPPRRTEDLVPLVREKLGPEMILYADANGSYGVDEAIRVGGLLEEYGVAFYEEPCPFDHLEETKAVADALSIPVAGGEQEASLRRFRWMIENNALQVVQPDLFYCGGLIRSIRIARMAAAAGLPCTPHVAGTPLSHLYSLHFASCVPNVGEYVEYKPSKRTLPAECPTSTLAPGEDGRIKIPTGPGLGVEFDRDYLRGFRKVSLP